MWPTMCALVTGIQTCATPIYGADVRLPDGIHVILAPVAAHLDEQFRLAVAVQGPVVGGAEFFQEIEGVDRMVIVGNEFDHCDAASSVGGGRVETSRLDRYRSEEHTSELQSLMRTSYADLC